MNGTTGKTSKTSVPCGCGCGAMTKPGSRFLQGHDARIPVGASCSRCRKPATIAAGRTPACDVHAADVIRQVANGDKRTSVRVLPPAPVQPKPAAKPRAPRAPKQDKAEAPAA